VQKEQPYPPFPSPFTGHNTPQKKGQHTAATTKSIQDLIPARKKFQFTLGR